MAHTTTTASDGLQVHAALGGQDAAEDGGGLAREDEAEHDGGLGEDEQADQRVGLPAVQREQRLEQTVDHGAPSGGSGADGAASPRHGARQLTARSVYSRGVSWRQRSSTCVHELLALDEMREDVGLALGRASIQLCPPGTHSTGDRAMAANSSAVCSRA